MGIAGQENKCCVLCGDSEQAGQVLGVAGLIKFWYWFRRGQELHLSWARRVRWVLGRDCSQVQMGGGGLLRIGLTHKDFLASLTMFVWVAFIV